MKSTTGHGAAAYISEDEVRTRLCPAAVIAAVEQGFGVDFGDFVLPGRT